MSLRLGILLLVVYCFLSFRQEKSLNVAIDGLIKVKLVLRDQLMGDVIETYHLSPEKYPAIVNDLNGAEHRPNLKMNITCYDIILIYPKGKRRRLPTNGKGIGPTRYGSFVATDNLVVKYWPIDKGALCKPKNPQKKTDGIGF